MPGWEICGNFGGVACGQQGTMLLNLSSKVAVFCRGTGLCCLGISCNFGRPPGPIWDLCVWEGDSGHN